MSNNYDSCIALVENESFFLPYLLARLAQSKQIGRILLYVPGRPWKNSWRRLIRNADAFGWTGLIVCGLSAVVARLMDLTPGRYYSVQKVAKEFDIPITTIRALEEVASYLPDKGDGRRETVFVQISDRIDTGLLSHANFINKHCGLLPFYRGVYPVYWAMVNNETVLGVTLHQMDDRFDTGPTLDHRSIPAKGHSFFSAHHALYDLAGDMLLEYFQKTRTPGVPQDSLKGSYYSYPGKAEREVLFRKWHLGIPFRLHTRLRTE